MSNENSNQSNRLQELGGSDYKIVEGQPNIKGWTVKDANGQTIGEVDELLFDPESRKVRYIILDLEGNTLDIESGHVLIPIGIAELHETDDDVILPNITVQQITGLPAYDKDSFSSDIEYKTSQVFSGFTEDSAIATAVLYDHDHFNENNLYKRRQEGSASKQNNPVDGPDDQY